MIRWSWTDGRFCALFCSLSVSVFTASSSFWKERNLKIISAVILLMNRQTKCKRSLLLIQFVKMQTPNQFDIVVEELTEFLELMSDWKLHKEVASLIVCLFLDNFCLFMVTTQLLRGTSKVRSQNCKLGISQANWLARQAISPGKSLCPVHWMLCYH